MKYLSGVVSLISASFGFLTFMVYGETGNLYSLQLAIIAAFISFIAALMVSLLDRLDRQIELQEALLSATISLNRQPEMVGINIGAAEK